MRERRLVVELALPNDRYTPAGRNKRSFFTAIAFSIAFELRPPVLEIGCRSTTPPAIVSMPKTSMYEDR